MINLSVARLAQIMVLAIVAVILAYQSIHSIRANAWYFNARNTLQQLSSPVDAAQLTRAEAAITLATKLEPTHPHYWHIYANVKILIASNVDGITAQGSDKKQLLYQQAEQALLTSVALRQTWAPTWITLAQLVSYQQGPSEQVYGYIQQAKKVGPHQLDVHLGIIHIALMHWPQLPANYKALYVNALQLAVKHGYRFNAVFALAKKINRLEILCLTLQFSEGFAPVRASYHFKKHCKTPR
ncbi:VpsP family polysaccharide biosynthesis protein [Pseudoalteromonas sp.]|uniref:VpsP family polysaccharide biosynthesis protein n=1 Tax=Pseudoalteromonas sp. TaxID=53249 RepID=UPI00356201C2